MLSALLLDAGGGGNTVGIVLALSLGAGGVGDAVGGQF